MASAVFLLSMFLGAWVLGPLPDSLPFFLAQGDRSIEEQREGAWDAARWMPPLRRATPDNAVLVFHKKARHGVHHSRYFLWPRKVMEYHQFEGRTPSGPVYHVGGTSQELERLGLPFQKRFGPFLVHADRPLAISHNGAQDPFLARRPLGRHWFPLFFGLFLWGFCGWRRSAGIFALVCSSLLFLQWNTPPLGFDSLALWMQKAKNFWVTGELAAIVRDSPRPFYPPLLPVLVGSLGFLGETAGSLVNLTFLFLLFLGTSRLIQNSGVSENRACLLSLGLLSVPAIWLHSFYAMANLPLAALLVWAAAELEEGKLRASTLVALTCIRLEGLAIVAALVLIEGKWKKRLAVFAPITAWFVFVAFHKEPPPLNPLPLPYPALWGSALGTYLFRLVNPAEWGLLPLWFIATWAMSSPSPSPTAGKVLRILGVGWTIAAVIAVGRWGNNSFFQSFDRYFLPWFALAYGYAAAQIATLPWPAWTRSPAKAQLQE